MSIIEFFGQSNDDVVALANVVIAFGTLMLAFGVPWSIKSARSVERDTFYATLDRTYFDLQKLIIEHPHLGKPGTTGKSQNQKIEYDAFAFMTWNFIESIFDYSRGDKKLSETWQCILDYESKLHGAWFDEPCNRVKFKTRFRNYIDEKNAQAQEVTTD